jgi:hypothetical protein
MISIPVPFHPRQPMETLKVGDMYLKSIDKHYRRQYDKYMGNDDSEQVQDNEITIQQLYVSHRTVKYIHDAFDIYSCSDLSFSIGGLFSETFKHWRHSSFVI